MEILFCEWLTAKAGGQFRIYTLACACIIRKWLLNSLEEMRDMYRLKCPIALRLCSVNTCGEYCQHLDLISSALPNLLAYMFLVKCLI